MAVSLIDPYQVEDAARTLTRADQIKRDPKMMAAVKKHTANLNRVVAAPVSRAQPKTKKR
jgi:hypothetical protein